mgnify:CR=1 FL=1|tara:strand:- start:301 stop:1296 length:996 start_codon:yes stop_codon:yes gene_type:complete
MAFLDNSGDIILDAVLTDLGRQRMSQGNFKITKFALGDDEIDYTLYNKNHPSGSAYYDIEILQTPCFEAFTTDNANINYGLLSFTRTDLLYLPSLVTNELTDDSPLFKTSSVFYIAANSETGTALNTVHSSSNYWALSSATNGRKIIIESGLDTTELTADSTTRASYMLNTNLLDSRYGVYFDNRFISAVITPTAKSVFTNSNIGADKVSFTMGQTTANSTTFMEDHSVVYARGVDNTVYYYANAQVADTAISAIAGPRGSATAVNVTMDSSLVGAVGAATNSKYTLYGTTGANLFDDGNTYDYIDTTVYVQGTSTSAMLQLPVRLVRRAS